MVSGFIKAALRSSLIRGSFGGRWGVIVLNELSPTIEAVPLKWIPSPSFRHPIGLCNLEFASEVTKS